jgi:hypothetical protein
MNKLSRRTNLQKICGTAAADVIGEGMTPQSAGKRHSSLSGRSQRNTHRARLKDWRQNPQTRFIGK